MNNFNDFKEAFRAFVLADDTVEELIEDRFYGAYLATFYTTSTSFPLATFTIDSGKETLYYRDFNIDIKAYSNQHYDEAHDVYQAIYNVLRQSTTDIRTVIHVATSTSELYDEVSRLYVVTGRFRAIRILEHD